MPNRATMTAVLVTVVGVIIALFVAQLIRQNFENAPL